MRHQRRGHSPAFFHHRGLLLLIALVLAICLLYSCAGSPVCGPKGRLVFIPLARAGEHLSLCKIIPGESFLSPRG